MIRPRRPAIKPSAIIPPVSGARASPVVALEYEGGVGSPESEAVRDHHIKPGIVPALAHDRDIGEFGVELLDIGALADEAVLHHQKAIDGFLDTRRTQGMAGERLGRRDRRDLVVKDL